MQHRRIERFVFSWPVVAPFAFALACSAEPDAGDPLPDDSGVGGSSTSSSATSSGVGGSGGELSLGTGGGQGGAVGECSGLPPSQTGPGVVLAPAFESHYSVLELGPAPGVPGRLGGCVLKHGDPNTLLIAGNSEDLTGAIYEVKIKRDECKHIVGFEGTATKVADTPHIDANILYGADQVLIYPQWPVNTISQHPIGSTQAAATTPALDGIGIAGGGSVSGLGFVPSYLGAAGQTRTLTWSEGYWYHLDLTFDGSLYQITNAQHVATLPNGPGGFAYVPPDSPGFVEPAIITAEWSVDKVAVYDANDEGDPLVETRQDFFVQFPKPWGAYFDPESGDYLFLTWGATPPDRVYVVRGFVKPPPPEVPQ
jgi:hypothetical protein